MPAVRLSPTSSRTGTQFSDVFKVFGARSAKEAGLPEEGFLTRWIQDLFRPKVTSAPVSKASGKSLSQKTKPTIDIGTKATIATTAASTAIFGSTILLTQTPGGQDLSKGVLNVGSDVTRFFTQNPLLLLALIGLGVILVVKK